jgi:hypothetical protein
MDPRQLPLGLEDGIFYITSQTIGECYFDALENIFTFADVFRPIFSGLAESLIKEGRGADLMTRNPSVRERLAAVLGIAAPNASMISFLDFCVEAMRRYVLVKYAERGLDEATISGWFGLPSLQSSCVTTFGIPDPGVGRRYWKSHARERRGSLNRLAGIHAAISGARAAGVYTTNEQGQYITARAPYIPFLTLVQRSIRQIPLLNSMILTQNVQYTPSGVDVVKPFDYPDYTWREGVSYRFFKQQALNVNVIAAYYQLIGRIGGHAIAFLRYQGEYYYCDNQIGIARQCYNDQTTKQQFINNIGQRVLYRLHKNTRPNIDTLIIRIGDYNLPVMTINKKEVQLKQTGGAIKEIEEAPPDSEMVFLSERAVIFQIRVGQEKHLNLAPPPPVGAEPGWRPEGAAAGAGGGAEVPRASVRRGSTVSRGGRRRRTLKKVRRHLPRS